MMTKTQKIWLWVSIAIFAIPELLWSPILTYTLPFFMGSSYKFRNSFIFSGYNSPLVASLVIFIQCLGVIFATTILYKNKENFRYKYIVLGFFFVLSLLSLSVLVLQIMLSRSDLLGL